MRNTVQTIIGTIDRFTQRLGSGLSWLGFVMILSVEVVMEHIQRQLVRVRRERRLELAGDLGKPLESQHRQPSEHSREHVGLGEGGDDHGAGEDHRNHLQLVELRLHVGAGRR